MYGLNAFAFVLFGVINVSAVQLCKCAEPIRKKVLRALCITLLVINIVQYTVPPMLGLGIKIPVEFSTVAYFAVPTILLAGLKRLRSWAAYSGLMAGFFYYMTMIISGGAIYNSYPPHNIYISMLCHGTLYLLGMVTLSTYRCMQTDRYTLVSGIGYIVLHANVLRPLAQGKERLFIYELLDGAYVKQLLPQSAWSVAMPAYYAVMVTLVLLTIALFFRLNRSRCEKYAL